MFPTMKAVAVLRNPWVRTLSAFHDYIRMGRIKTSVGTPQGMEELVSGKIWLVQSGERNLEDFDVRILTSGVYIHGLRACPPPSPRLAISHVARHLSSSRASGAWSTWSSSQLYVVRSEDMFERTAGESRDCCSPIPAPSHIPITSTPPNTSNSTPHSQPLTPTPSHTHTLATPAHLKPSPPPHLAPPSPDPSSPSPPHLSHCRRTLENTAIPGA